MKLTEHQRHEVLRELIPNLPYPQIAARVLTPKDAGSPRKLAPGPMGWVRRQLGEFVRRWRHASEREAAITELTRLGPARLADIGLEHADIERVVDALLAAKAAAAAEGRRADAHVAADFVDRR